LMKKAPSGAFSQCKRRQARRESYEQQPYQSVTQLSQFLFGLR